MRTKISKLVTSGMVGASLFGTGFALLPSVPVHAEEINTAATTEYVNGEAFVTPYYKITPSYPKKAAPNTEVPVYYNVEFLKQTELYAVQVLATITNGTFLSTAPKSTSLTETRVNFLDTDRTKQYKIMVKTGATGQVAINGKLSAVGDDMKEPEMAYSFSVEIGEQTPDELTKAKEVAKQEINTLPNLSAAEKADFVQQVDAAKDIPTVNKIVDAAKNKDKENAAAALAKAKEAAKQEINALPNLSAAEKADFVQQVDAATDIPTVNKIVEAAKNKDKTQETTGTTETSKEEVKPVPSTTDSTKGTQTQQTEPNKETGSVRMGSSSNAANSKGSLPSTGEENNNVYKIVGVVSMLVVLGAYFYKKILKGTSK